MLESKRPCATHQPDSGPSVTIWVGLGCPMEDRYKRILRIAIVIGVALGSGHVVQSNTPASQRADGQVKPVPKDIVQLSAELPKTSSMAETGTSEELPLIVPGPARQPLAAVPMTLPQPEARVEIASPDCETSLDIDAAPGAMIEVALSSPCRADQRVVLRHAALTVTYRTNAAGLLVASIPAMRESADISVLFRDGTVASATVDVPEADAYRRFGVQWLGGQAFQVNAFEDGADFGDPGHISSANPGRPDTRLLARHGFLSVLGSDQVPAPLLAEIYTFPTGSARVPVLVEAAVTSDTCNRDLVGQMIEAKRGEITTSDLAVSMPGCDAVGQYLELKNLRPGTKLASAD